MQYLFLSQGDPLVPLLDLTIKDSYYDLHNEFKCTKITYIGNTLEIHLYRNNNNLRSGSEKSAMIIFSDIVECNYTDIQTQNNVGDITSIMNFSRGLLTSDNLYFEHSEIKYYFIGFYEGELIDILCKQAIIIFW